MWSAAQAISQYSHSTIIGPVIMGIVGNLRTMQLEELLQWLSQSKKNGTLEIVHGPTEKKIFFKDGLILSSASNRPEEYLGHFLVNHGHITEAQLNRAIESQQQTRMLLGMILVNNGAISEQELSRMLRLKAEVEEELAAAVQFGRESPLPEPEEALDDLYATPLTPALSQRERGAT